MEKSNFLILQTPNLYTPITQKKTQLPLKTTNKIFAQIPMHRDSQLGLPKPQAPLQSVSRFPQAAGSPRDITKCEKKEH